METDDLAPPHPHEPSSQPTGILTESIALDLLQLDGGTQTRVKLNQEGVEDYAKVMKERGVAALPPVTVYRDEAGHCWLADGFHRVAAAQRIEQTEIQAEIHFGSRLDALKYSLQANWMHGVRRTNADKRRSVEIVLAEETLREQSDNVLAELCGVSNHLVTGVRRKLEERGELQVGNSPTSVSPIKRLGKDKKLHPAQKRRKAESSTAVAPALKVVVADNEDEDAKSEDTNVSLKATVADDAFDAKTTPPAMTESEVQLPVKTSNGEGQEAETGLESAEANIGINSASEAPAMLAAGDGHPTDDTRWDDGVLTAGEIRARLELMPQTHPHPSEVEQTTFQDCFLELVRTVNRLALVVCASRSTRGEIALDAAKVLGNFISARSTKKYQEQQS